MRPAGFGAVIQHHLDRVPGFLSDHPRIGNVGEPVPVVPCDVVCGRDGILIGVVDVFVTHSGAHLTHTGDIAAVRSKSGNIILFNGRFRGRDIDTSHFIIIRATGKSILRSGLQLSFPDGIGKHRLGSVHPSRVVTGAVDGGVVSHFTGFFRYRLGTVVGAIVVQVDIDTQLSCDEAVVIEVGAKVIGRPVPNGVVRKGSQLVYERSIFKNVVIDLRMHAVSQMPAPLHLAAQKMIVGHLPVHAGVSIEGAADIFVQERSLVLEEPVFSGGGYSEGLLLQLAFLPGCIAGIVDPTEEVPSSRAVVNIDGAEGIIPPGPPQGLGVGSIQIEAESVSLPLDGLDSHYSPHRCIVLCSRIGYYLDTLDFIALQAVQLRAVRDSPSINIHQWRAFAYHLQTVLPLDKSRRFGKHVLGATRILQHGATHIRLQSFTREFGLGHNGTRYSPFQHLRVIGEGNHRAVNGSEIHCPVTQHGHHHDAVRLAGYNIEGAVLLGDDTAHDRRIGRREDCHVGVCYRLAFFINYFPFPIVLCQTRKR